MNRERRIWERQALWSDTTIEAKAAINRARTWSAPDAEGVCVHVREDDADAHYAAEVERQKGQAPA